MSNVTASFRSVDQRSRQRRLRRHSGQPREQRRPLPLRRSKCPRRSLLLSVHHRGAAEEPAGNFREFKSRLSFVHVFACSDMHLTTRREVSLSDNETLLISMK